LSWLIAFWALLTAIVPAPVSADPPGVVVSQQVRDQLQRNGKTRVLVELHLPAGAHVPEGDLSRAGVTLQRQDIASAHSQILSRLRSGTHRVLHRYRTVPFIALEVAPVC
jgi:hypothetical protein